MENKVYVKKKSEAKDAFILLLPALAEIIEGGGVGVIKVSTLETIHTKNQRNFLEGSIRFWSINNGNISNAEHEVFRNDVLKEVLGKDYLEYITPSGIKRTIEGRVSTAGLSKYKFIELTEKIRAMAADNGVILPTPEELNEEKDGNPFYDKN